MDLVFARPLILMRDAAWGSEALWPIRGQSPTDPDQEFWEMTGAPPPGSGTWWESNQLSFPASPPDQQAWSDLVRLMAHGAMLHWRMTIGWSGGRPGDVLLTQLHLSGFEGKLSQPPRWTVNDSPQGWQLEEWWQPTSGIATTPPAVLGEFRFRVRTEQTVPTTLRIRLGLALLGFRKPVQVIEPPLLVPLPAHPLVLALPAVRSAAATPLPPETRSEPGSLTWDDEESKTPLRSPSLEMLIIQEPAPRIADPCVDSRKEFEQLPAVWPDSAVELPPTEKPPAPGTGERGEPERWLLEHRQPQGADSELSWEAIARPDSSPEHEVGIELVPLAEQRKIAGIPGEAFSDVELPIATELSAELRVAVQRPAAEPAVESMSEFELPVATEPEDGLRPEAVIKANLARASGSAFPAEATQDIVADSMFREDWEVEEFEPEFICEDEPGSLVQEPAEPEPELTTEQHPPNLPPDSLQPARLPPVTPTAIADAPRVLTTPVVASELQRLLTPIANPARPSWIPISVQPDKELEQVEAELDQLLAADTDLLSTMANWLDEE